MKSKQRKHPVQNPGKEEEKEYDLVFKIKLMGDAGTGKTSIIRRFVFDSFTYTYGQLKGVERGEPVTRNVTNSRGQRVQLRVYDTTPWNRVYCTVGANSIGHRMNHYLFVFDVCDARTFHNVKMWIDEVKRHIGDEFFERNVTFTIVGTKSDDEQNRQVDSYSAEEFAESLDVKYFEVSSITGANIDSLFTNSVEEISERNLPQVVPAGPIAGEVIDRRAGFLDRIANVFRRRNRPAPQRDRPEVIARPNNNNPEAAGVDPLADRKQVVLGRHNADQLEEGIVIEFCSQISQLLMDDPCYVRGQDQDNKNKTIRWYEFAELTEWQTRDGTHPSTRVKFRKEHIVHDREQQQRIRLYARQRMKVIVTEMAYSLFKNCSASLNGHEIEAVISRLHEKIDALPEGNVVTFFNRHIFEMYVEWLEDEERTHKSIVANLRQVEGLLGAENVARGLVGLLARYEASTESFSARIAALNDKLDSREKRFRDKVARADTAVDANQNGEFRKLNAQSSYLVNSFRLLFNDLPGKDSPSLDMFSRKLQGLFVEMAAHSGFNKQFKATADRVTEVVQRFFVECIKHFGLQDETIVLNGEPQRLEKYLQETLTGLRRCKEPAQLDAELGNFKERMLLLTGFMNRKISPTPRGFAAPAGVAHFAVAEHPTVAENEGPRGDVEQSFRQ